jgi:dihydrofolate reductase
MRKLIYSFGVSLDGYIETTDRRLDWSAPDEELHRYHNEQARAADTYLYGRRMYELMSEFWPTADEDPAAPDYVAEYARIWRAADKIVYSRTLEKVDGELVREVVADQVEELKARPGKDLAVSGAALAASFMRLGLIDEYRLLIHPVVLGGGTPFFPDLDTRANLRLAETRTFESGVVLLHYETVR